MAQILSNLEGLYMVTSNSFFKDKYDFIIINNKPVYDWSIMDKQKINCTVESCKFNDYNTQECLLKQITVTPKQNCNTKQPEESMCSSYENHNQ